MHGIGQCLSIGTKVTERAIRGSLHINNVRKKDGLYFLVNQVQDMAVCDLDGKARLCHDTLHALVDKTLVRLLRHNHFIAQCFKERNEKRGQLHEKHGPRHTYGAPPSTGPGLSRFLEGGFQKPCLPFGKQVGQIALALYLAIHFITLAAASVKKRLACFYSDLSYFTPVGALFAFKGFDYVL